MASQTTTYQFPYPQGIDTPNIHTDIQNLAQRMETVLSESFVKLSGNNTLSGNLTAASFVKTGGSATEFLKANGSVDTNTYLTTSAASSTYLTQSSASTTYQPLDADLTSIAAISTNGILINTSGTWSTITDSSTNWDTAYTDRFKWDGGSTGLTASTGRTSLGATTVGSNLFTLANPSTISFIKINADNTVSTESAASFISSLGLGTMATETASNYLTTSNASLTYQPLDTDLTELAGINASSGSTGLVKRNANNTYSIDTTAYLTSVTAHASSHESGGTDEIRGALTYNTISGSGSLTLSTSNTTHGLNRMNFINHSGALTLTLPTDTTFATGTQIHFLVTSSNAGVVQFVTNGVSSQGSKYKFNGQHSAVTAVKTGASTWTIFGNLIA